MGAESRIPVGVVGVGYVGRYHAEKYFASQKAFLVGVVDIERSRAEEVGRRLGVAAFTDYRELLGRVRCVSVAVPTLLHYEVARDFLRAGIDVLVEKPMAATLEEAQKLVALARSFIAARALLLLDEPMEGLSPALSARLAAATREFQQQEPDLSVLGAESDLNRMQLLTERVYTIERGEVVEEARLAGGEALPRDV